MDSKVVALTGSIACGKSTAARLLKDLGWQVVDSDEIVHELYQPGGAGVEKVVDAFGKMVLSNDGSVNRSVLGRLVFLDSTKRKLLESLIHPLVRTVWQQKVREHQCNQPNTSILVIIPLLFEVGLAGEFNTIVCVGSPAKVQHKRLQERGLDDEQIVQRLEAQWPLERKMEQSHIVIWNSGSIELLRRQVLTLHERHMACCK
jgi:dephospho-CoA kinase